MSTEITTTQSPTALQASQTFELLSKAVEAGQSTETLERLLDMQERVMKVQARQAYMSALAEFQSRVPPISKTRSVKKANGQLLYKFAPLEDITEQVKPLLHELGLSVSYDTTHHDNGAITVVCIVRHIGGHEERNSVYVPQTQGHNTNAAQNMGIQLSYGKRYGLINGLGITTADEDTDGRSEEIATITAEQVATIRALIEETGSNEAKLLAYAKATAIEHIQQQRYGVVVTALEKKRGQK